MTLGSLKMLRGQATNLSNRRQPRISSAPSLSWNPMCTPAIRERDDAAAKRNESKVDQHGAELERFVFSWNRLSAGILCSGKARGTTRCDHRKERATPSRAQKTKLGRLAVIRRSQHAMFPAWTSFPPAASSKSSHDIHIALRCFPRCGEKPCPSNRSHLKTNRSRRRAGRASPRG